MFEFCHFWWMIRTFCAEYSWRIYYCGMLLSLTLENYRSFRDRAVLDLQKRSFRTLLPKDGDWVAATQRQAAIIGPNAAGKSNILRAVSVISAAVRQSLRDKNVKFLYDPFATTTDKPTYFRAEYAFKGVRYEWECSVSGSGIQKETLRAVDRGRWKLIFSRSAGEIEFGSNSQIPASARENIEQFLLPWTLTLSAWGGVKSRGPYYPAAEWWTDLVMTILPIDMDRANRHQWLISVIADDPRWFEMSHVALRSADLGISSLNVNEQEIPPEVRSILKKIEEATSKSDRVEAVPSSDVEELIRELEFVHDFDGEEVRFSEEDESAGTRNWLDLVVPAMYCLTKGGVLLVDELDSSLHPDLVRLLIELFSDTNVNLRGAQIVYTTHDMTVLGNHPTPVVLPSETWLVEKFCGASELVALDEYDIRSSNNVERRYLQGVYNAKPFVSPEPLAALIRKLVTSQGESDV